MPLDPTLLENLHSNTSTLIELDLTYCSLSFADLEVLVDALAENTTLSTLNLSGNPVGNAGFALLLQSLNHMTTLVLRDCSITRLDCSTPMSKLLNLDLANNRLDGKSAEYLAELSLRNLSLAGNQCEDDVAIALAKSSTLTSLTLSHNKIKSEGCRALSNNTSIKTLILNYNMIQTEGINFLATNKNIESLCVAGNSIDENGILVLAYHNDTITHLDISYNFVNDAAFGTLGCNSHFKYLDVGFNQITYKGVQQFVKNNKSLQSLIICHNLLGNLGAVAALKHPTITHLDLSGNSIGFDGGRAVFFNKVLKTLIISSNMLGETGGIMLAQNTTLTELYASYNEIGDDAAAIFSDNKILKVLNLNYNAITDEGRKSLLNNHALVKLILSAEQPPEFTSENLVTMFSLAESFQCISDAHGTIQFFNPAFSRVLGYKTDELLSKSAYDFLHPEDLPSEKTRHHENTLIQNYVNRYRCSDGTYRTFEWRSQLKHKRRYADGHDITLRLYDQQESLSNFKKHADSLLQESKDNAERQINFMSHLSHEIRNPLSGTIGLLEICLQEATDFEKLISQLDDSLSSMHKLTFINAIQAITDNLKSMEICTDYQLLILNTNLAIIKITDKNFKLDQTPFDLKNILGEVVPMLIMKANLKGITTSVSTPDLDHIWVQGDNLRLKQIIMNLFGNAIKFTEQGTISLSLIILERTDDITRAEICIKDSGIGLTHAEQAILFGRWVQANHTIEGQYGGTGLGLHLAKQLAIAMNGDISVLSEIGKGSTFTVTLELKTLSKQAKIALEEKQDSIHSFSQLSVSTGALGLLAVKPREKRTILVVDDNTINRKLLIRVLIAAGHTCIEAADGEEAVAIFSINKNINLIFMDIQMPKKNGIQATIEIRAIEKKLHLRHIAIFAMTANVNEIDKTTGRDAGMDRYFTKPIDKNAILAGIDALPNLVLPEAVIGRSNTAPSFIH